MKVLFDLAKNQISIEGGGADLISVLKLVQEVAPKVSKIEFISIAASAKSAADTPPASGDDRQKQGAPGMREFARSISPVNNYEKIAAIAAYKTKFEGVIEFSPKEMGEWFVMCGWEKPSQMPVAMFDAKRKYGFLDKAGHGKWKLSTGGQNLVTRRQEGVGAGQS